MGRKIRSRRLLSRTECAPFPCGRSREHKGFVLDTRTEERLAHVRHRPESRGATSCLKLTATISSATCPAFDVSSVNQETPSRTRIFRLENLRPGRCSYSAMSIKTHPNILEPVAALLAAPCARQVGCSKHHAHASNARRPYEKPSCIKVFARRCRPCSGQASYQNSGLNAEIDM